MTGYVVAPSCGGVVPLCLQSSNALFILQWHAVDLQMNQVGERVARNADDYLDQTLQKMGRHWWADKVQERLGALIGS